MAPAVFRIKCKCLETRQSPEWSRPCLSLQSHLSLLLASSSVLQPPWIPNVPGSLLAVHTSYPQKPESGSCLHPAPTPSSPLHQSSSSKPRRRDPPRHPPRRPLTILRLTSGITTAYWLVSNPTYYPPPQKYRIRTSRAGTPASVYAQPGFRVTVVPSLRTGSMMFTILTQHSAEYRHREVT